jgi:acetyltransferase-like isoleucine patch superfamily enzyme
MSERHVGVITDLGGRKIYPERRPEPRGTDHPHPHSIVNAYIGPTVLVGPFCNISKVNIGAGTKIGPYTHIMIDSDIGRNCRLEGCYIEGAKLGNNVSVWRNAHLLRSFIGDGTMIGHGCFVADGSRIGKNCRLMLNAGIGRVTTIGDDVYIGPNVVLSNSAPDGKLLPVLVGDGAWIGANAVTTEGVHIGHHSVIGAGAVVTKEVEPFQVVVGNPARVIGDTRDGK